MYGSAQLPKFAGQAFKLHDEDYHHYLIPTSEVALMGLHNNEILDAESLPRKYVSYTPCFRREAGGLGANERGLIRMHQFNKVEMFAFTTPEQSQAIFDEMIASAEGLIKGLGLHFQVTELVTGDMSFAGSKTIDLEVWLPGQDRYYEVSSVSHCSDFQARRSHTRYKVKEEKPQFCHTLNGSGLATSRLMVALLENNQREDGSVEIPLVLHKYLNGMKELTPT
jgi:seryl-tRNA synthetase